MVIDVVSDKFYSFETLKIKDKMAENEITSSLPVLNAEEIRVLGALIEKSKTTPDYYPMTLNGLKNACNQKTSRNPVVDYDENLIADTLESLKQKGLVYKEIGGGSRVVKYEQKLLRNFTLPPADAAVICLLMLRGPLTAGEINTNSARLYDFDNLEEVNEVLDKLSRRAPAMVKKLERQPGQKGERFIHLFSEYSEDDFMDNTTLSSSTSNRVDLEERIIKLETDLAQLKEEFEKLLKELS